jgi:hypothetical protein
MAPRPSSPTSLLWAHQIKRENAHLLSRMKALETATEELKGKVMTIDTSNKKTCETVKACSALEVRVQLIEEDDKEQQMRFGALDKDRNDRIEKQEFTLNVMAKKVRALETQYLDLKEERAEPERGDDGASLKRIEKLEATLDKLIAENTGAKHKTIEDIVFVQTVNERVEQLEYKRMDDQNGIKSLHERLEKLEQAKMDAGRRHVSILNANLKQKLQLVGQTPELGLSSPSAGQIQVPSSPLAKRRIERLDGPSAKRQAGKSKNSIAEDTAYVETAHAHAKKSQLQNTRSPALTRASQRYRT